jgi:hypothetical protein
MHFGLRRIEPRHLPVPARQRQFEQRLADRLRELVGAFLGRSDIGDQRAQVDVEPAIEGALDGLTVDRRQATPVTMRITTVQAGRPQEQAERERVSAHRAG